MPFRARFVLRRDFPRRLVYKGATLALEIVRVPLSRDSEWILRAKKIVPTETCVIAKSRYGRYGFDTMVFSEGFVLESGTPAAKIMERLAREGFAVGRPERRRA